MKKHIKTYQKYSKIEVLRSLGGDLGHLAVPVPGRQSQGESSGLGGGLPSRRMAEVSPQGSPLVPFGILTKSFKRRLPAAPSRSVPPQESFKNR